MINLLLIAIGGALGAISRYGVHILIDSKVTAVYPSGAFPLGIFTINILGSILLGVFFALITTVWEGSHTLKLLLLVGFFGSFTTFSTFSLNTVELIEAQAYLEAFIYIFGSVLLSVGGLFLGLTITKQIIL